MAADSLTNGVEKMLNGTENGVNSVSDSLRFANKLLIHGGNISNWNRTKRKTTTSSADEVNTSTRFCNVIFVILILILIT